ncbi:class I SAM-dependent methyltransferase [Solwaraspora sp. WMMD406]|uniref:class I SAM-dependent methyltransferase n=1 Tax=Solwaraspora sp. WMMD406 TaxID=3016095 RepID=UPI002417396C|nr:class I SAM-dependent methyltransferase [Solwaraspora sp. WMMD406]MDG4766298.1 class I SAM-dependent methyltransferase [Solwaraspora sp. WMMD406]
MISETPLSTARPEPGSFRDPANQVFYVGDQVLRGMDPQAAEDWQTISGGAFLPPLIAAGKVIGTETADLTDLPEAAGRWTTVLRHERVPFVSYPYEWSFAMLRDAARLHLEILQAALADGVTMRDGSAYNLQWRGAEPVFIDVGSFQPGGDGEPWAGYRQFCQTMLYPLLLQAHLDLDFQPWLRARIDGIESGQMRRLFSGTRRLRAGVLKHVHLHDAMQARNASATTGAVRAEIRDAGFSRELVQATVRAVAKLVDRLDWAPARSHWVNYQQTCTYSPADRDAKTAFVDAELASSRPGLVFDLGANDGTYSRLAARHARYVVAVESDPAVVDTLYRDLRGARQNRILPILMDLADPSSGGGWAGTERAPFGTRARADTVLALAVIHHLAIGRNVPLPRILDWLLALLPTAPGPGAGQLIVEFVHPDDPMARQLLANKPAGLFADYHRPEFERLLTERCEITRREELPSGTRTLYVGTPRRA